MYIDKDFKKSLPEPLSSIDTINYFNEYKRGNTKARDKLIIHNTRLILNVINKYIDKTYIDEEELFSIGSIGLIKTVDTFDLDKGHQFTTYAVTCIKNEIIVSLRKKKKFIEISYDTILKSNSNDKYFTIKDTLSEEKSNIDEFMDSYNNMVIMNQVINIIDTFPNRDKEIFNSYFGIYPYNRINQRDLAKKYNLSRSGISKIIRNYLEVIRRKLRIKNLDRKLTI